jgi:hypothetical protein
MTTKTKAVRALNDELRQNFTTGTAVMTAGVAALGAETLTRIVKTIVTISATPTTHTRNMTSAYSKWMARQYSLRSIILISHASITRRIRPIRRSLSA